MLPDRTGRVAGVVLAAGQSARLGTNKLLLRLDSEPLVRRAARLALEAGLSPVIVVLGHEAEQVAAALDGLPVVRVVNPDFRAGMHRTLQHGIEQVPGECAAAVVLLADMPFVSAAMLAELVARFRSGTEPLVLSLYGEVQAPPTLYARSLFPEIAAAGEACGRRIVLAHRGEAAELRWPEAALADIDRPEDAARIGLRPAEPQG
ncbi:MAG TPA: nucleotidyltransferase family protein [Gemmatimonadales bacterium]|nr:nucleotidyltransferase family protein [Gemmatimonadales bacterium]